MKIWKNKNKYSKAVLKTKNVFLVSILVSLFIIASFLYESYNSYQNEIKKAEIQAANLTQLLEEKITDSFKNIDISMQALQDEVSKDEKKFNNPKAYVSLLETHRKRIPETLSIKFADSNGKLLVDDKGVLYDVSIADREYFQEIKKNPINKMVISKPVISKTAKVWIIVLARPLLINRTFKGIVLTTITLDHYKKIFESIDVGQNGVINLVGTNHFLYARKPWRDNLLGIQIPFPKDQAKILSKIQQSLKIRTRSFFDEEERLFSIRKINNYPLLVIVGFSVNDVLADWQNGMIIHSVLVFLVIGVFIFFHMKFLVSLEKIEEQRKQTIQNAKLTSLGEMASGIAHEINNPLTIILATAKKIKKHGKDDGILCSDGLDKIITTTDRISKIIKGLHSFSRDSFNDPEVPASVNKIIYNALDLCQEKLKSNSIFLNVNIPEDCYINCKEIQISQVIMNLISNSIDAINEDDDKWIRIEVVAVGENVNIIVTDSGKKIPDHIATRIMQPFFTTKEPGKGTGLGLSISKGIIESHKGRFYLDRTAKHTTFVIELKRHISLAA